VAPGRLVWVKHCCFKGMWGGCGGGFVNESGGALVCECEGSFKDCKLPSGRVKLRGWRGCLGVFRREVVHQNFRLA